MPPDAATFGGRCQSVARNCCLASSTFLHVCQERRDSCGSWKRLWRSVDRSRWRYVEDLGATLPCRSAIQLKKSVEAVSILLMTRWSKRFQYRPLGSIIFPMVPVYSRWTGTHGTSAIASLRSVRHWPSCKSARAGHPEPLCASGSSCAVMLPPQQVNPQAVKRPSLVSRTGI